MKYNEISGNGKTLNLKKNITTVSVQIIIKLARKFKKKLAAIPCSFVLSMIIFSSMTSIFASSSSNEIVLSGSAEAAYATKEEGGNNNRIQDNTGYHTNIPIETPLPVTSSIDSPPFPSPSLPESASPVSTTSLNEEFTTQAALSSAAARQTNNIVSTKAYYDVVFTTPTGGPIKRIDMVFPAGTDLSAVRLLETEGIGAGGPGVTGNTLTYFVSNPAATVPAGTQIRLEFANIGNPAVPNAGYKVTVTTRDAAGTIIDGPTDTFTYVMKQIGNSDIADNAITTEKIADGTVGTNDIADSAVTAAKLSEDAVHVVWEDNTPGNFDVLYRSNAIAGFEPSTTNLSNNPMGSVVPSIATSSNNVYVVWSDGILGSNEILFRRSTDGGATFGSTLNLSNDPANSFWPVIAVSGSSVYVVWSDNNEILYRRSTDGGATFGSTVNLSNIPGTSIQPAIAASANNVYVVWLDNSPGNNDIFYRRSTDGGATFGSIINLSNNTGTSDEPAIATSGDNVYVIWHDDILGDFEILIRTSTDGGATFGSIINVSTIGGSLEPAIAASGSNVHVAWGRNGGSADILIRTSTDGGATFGSIINVSNNEGDSVTPSITVSDNTVYVVWRDTSQVVNSVEILLRVSTDEGATFGRTINLSNNDGGSSNPSISVSGNDL